MGILWFPSWKSKCSRNSGIGIWTERGRILPSDSIWKLWEYAGSDQENWEYLIEKNLAAGTGVGSRCGFGGGFWREQPVTWKEREKCDTRPIRRKIWWFSISGVFGVSYMRYEIRSHFSLFSLTGCNTPSYTAKSTPWSDALDAADNLKWYLALSFIQPLCVSIPKQNHS